MEEVALRKKAKLNRFSIQMSYRHQSQKQRALTKLKINLWQIFHWPIKAQEQTQQSKAIALLQKSKWSLQNKKSKLSAIDARKDIRNWKYWEKGE